MQLELSFVSTVLYRYKNRVSYEHTRTQELRGAQETGKHQQKSGGQRQRGLSVLCPSVCPSSLSSLSLGSGMDDTKTRPDALSLSDCDAVLL